MECYWVSPIVRCFIFSAERAFRTVLSSAGNDGRVRLWKAALGGNIWRPAGCVGVEQTEETGADGDKDVDMQS